MYAPYFDSMMRKSSITVPNHGLRMPQVTTTSNCHNTTRMSTTVHHSIYDVPTFQLPLQYIPASQFIPALTPVNYPLPPSPIQSPDVTTLFNIFPTPPSSPTNICSPIPSLQTPAKVPNRKSQPNIYPTISHSQPRRPSISSVNGNQSTNQNKIVLAKMQPASTTETTRTYATYYPHKIFVGSLSRTTSPAELANFFRSYGTVIEAKVVLDASGYSKGYGFVSFDSSEVVSKILSSGPLYLQSKRIAVASAIRKMHFDEEI